VKIHGGWTHVSYDAPRATGAAALLAKHGDVPGTGARARRVLTSAAVMTTRTCKGPYQPHPIVTANRKTLASLKATTGRSQEDWLELLARSGVRGGGARTRWLVSQHGLGGGRAELLALTSVGECRQLIDPEAVAQITPATRKRVELRLVLPGVRAQGRLAALPPARGANAPTHRIALASAADVDEEVGHWLAEAHARAADRPAR